MLRSRCVNCVWSSTVLVNIKRGDKFKLSKMLACEKHLSKDGKKRLIRNIESCDLCNRGKSLTGKKYSGVVNGRKVCTKCKIEKSVSEFYRDDSASSGYKTWCKSCMLEYNKRKNGVKDVKKDCSDELLEQITKIAERLSEGGCAFNLNTIYADLDIKNWECRQELIDIYHLSRVLKKLGYVVEGKTRKGGRTIYRRKDVIRSCKSCDNWSGSGCIKELNLDKDVICAFNYPCWENCSNQQPA